jgi:ADP-dependent NAD(P)H-hydrate dehydratase / NAD(P)H-hydrate epimerase
LAPGVPLSSTDVAVLDRNSEALGVPTQVLMENAGAHVAKAVADGFPKGRVLVLLGRGNNGGDGAVAARLLKEQGREVEAVLAAGELRMGTEIAAAALEAMIRSDIKVELAGELDVAERCRGAGVIVDALMGVGAKGALREPVRSVVLAARDAADAGVPVVAVDLPTGYEGDPVLPARLTVTMHDRKVGMQEEVCGEIIVADIGIPEEAGVVVGPGDLEHRYPRTPAEAHKGKMGKILIVGGGPYTGAPVLSGLAAFMTGTDLVHMALPRSAARVAQQTLLEAIVHPLQGERLGRAHGPFVEGLLDDAQVLLLGPGLGKEGDTLAAVRDLVKAAGRKGLKVVLDGDVFSAFKEGGVEMVKREGFVLTPHAGEFLALTGIELPEEIDKRRAVVQEWVGEEGCVVLLKGKEDLIISKDAFAINRTHDPVMTTGGTGDVLAGVTAALLGRGMSPFDAAKVAAYLNGCAGVLAREESGYGVRARDVALQIPRVLAKTFPRPE